MKITFIMPSIGRKDNDPKYMRTWQMEPLPIAALASLTPEKHERSFFDDRLEHIDYDLPTDIVVITVETYTARRAYEIALEYKKRGVTVIMGGFHVTLVPEEVEEYADVLVLGEAEDLWAGLLEDFENNCLKKRYKSLERPSLAGHFPDRSIFKDKDYMKLGLVETGRGCPFTCEFCSIQSFYSSSYIYRPVEDVVAEIKSLKFKYYFFVDDNIVSNPQHAKRLFKALIPLKIKWFTQGTINMANDPEMLELMVESGCVGVLIGFESLNDTVLAKMDKDVNIAHDRDKSIKVLTDAGIRIYATFVFGYDEDTRESFDRTFEFVMKHKFFIAAFNHMVPFPGTPFFERLKDEGRLIDEKYWLDHDYNFGDVAFNPKNFTAEELRDVCFEYRSKFYDLSSIFKRLFVKNNFRSFMNPFYFLMISLMSRKDVRKRQGLPMGLGVPFK